VLALLGVVVDRVLQDEAVDRGDEEPDELVQAAMGLTLDHGQRATAYPQLLVAQAALGRAGLLLMLTVTGLTAVNTFNGGFVTMSRFMYAVAREGKLPRTFTYLNDRAVPAVPVLILGITSLVVAIASPSPAPGR